MGINAGGMDQELLGSALDRKRLLEQLAPLLRRVGPSHDNRSEVNHANSIKRKELRRALKKNAAVIAARVMQLYSEQISDNNARQWRKLAMEAARYLTAEQIDAAARAAGASATFCSPEDTGT